MDILKKIVGGHIREYRRKAGYKTVEAFAEALDVHPNSVGELERGANWVSPEMLEKLMTLFGAPPAAFFPGSNRAVKPTPEEALEVLREALTEKPKEAENLTPARLRLLELIGALNEAELESLTRTLEFQLSPATDAELLDLGADEDRSQQGRKPLKRG